MYLTLFIFAFFVAVWASPLLPKEETPAFLSPTTALRLYNSQLNTKMELVRVLSAKQSESKENEGQLELQIRPTACKRCASEICSFTVNRTSLIHHICGKWGGFYPVPTDDSRVVQAATFAVYDLNRMSNCLYQYKLVTIDDAQLKVEDGNDFMLNITACMYNPSYARFPNPCQQIHPEIIQHCVLNVLVHPWEKQETILVNFKCTGCA